MSDQNKQIEVLIITPERVVFQGPCDFVSIPASDGRIGVYKGHIPIFTRINQGEAVVHNGKEALHLSVAGGFVEVRKDKVTILADSALRSEDLEEEKIIEAKKKAEQKLQQKLSRQEYLAAEAQLRRVLLDLKVAERRKRSLTKINS